MSGSKKGERRGNARKRPAKPAGSRVHESPREIMREAGRKAGPHGNDPVVVERRIQISRLIAGYSGEVEDTTPKEALLLGMWHNLQAYRDWLDVIEELSQRPPTPENTALCEHAEREAERLLDKMGEFAFKVAGYIHPKLQATNIIGQTGANQTAILQLLMEEMDERERNAPIPIEYKPIKTGG